MHRKGYSRGVVAGVALALIGTVGGAVGWSSHPVGNESHPKSIYNKDCVGKPPRQTSDPLSPPCIWYYAGDNGGSTAPGVSGDEVRVVLYNDLGVDGDLTTMSSYTDEQLGHQASIDGTTTWLVRTLKNQVAYFQRHFQTFGRTVRVIARSSANGSATGCIGRWTDAIVAWRDLEPFAFTTLGDQPQCFIEMAAELGVPTIGFLTDLPREVYFEHKGMVWSFGRDLEEQASMSAGFICDKLVGRRARFAGDTSLQSATRRFALLFPLVSSRGPELALQAGELRRDLEERCGLTPSSDGSTGLIIKSFRNDGGTEVPLIMADLKLKGVTTVACVCVAVTNEVSVLRFQSAATALGYLPEWYFDVPSRMYQATWHRRYSVQAQTSFGLTPEWLIPDHGWIEDAYPYQASTEHDWNAQPNMRFAHQIYYGLHLLFTAIQRSGADLNLTNLRRGLKGHELLIEDETVPYGSFGEGENPYTFQRGALAWRWDPEGNEPGDRRGCLRTRGHLAIDGHWRPVHTDLDGSGTCMAPHALFGPGSEVL